MKHEDYYISPDDGYNETRHHSNKKTKEWCKGKVGTKHNGKWEAYKPETNRSKDWKVFICQNCRKFMKMDIPDRSWGTS